MSFGTWGRLLVIFPSNVCKSKKFYFLKGVEMLFGAWYNIGVSKKIKGGHLIEKKNIGNVVIRFVGGEYQCV